VKEISGSVEELKKVTTTDKGPSVDEIKVKDKDYSQYSDQSSIMKN
jgi:hypothetical protein